MRAIVNQIYIGSLTDPDYYFENDLIMESPAVQAVAMVGQELSIDAFNPKVADDYSRSHSAKLFRSSDGHVIQLGDGSLYAIDVWENPDGSGFMDIPYGTPMWYKHKGELVGKFYITKVHKQAKNVYQVNGVSSIGILEKMYTGGGLFLASTVGDVLRFILAEGLHGTGSPVINYFIDDDVARLPVSGHIAYMSKRNALYQLIFANGINIIKDEETGDPRFTFIYTASTHAVPIADKDIVYGGSVEFEKPYSRIEVTEHTYTPDTTAEAVTLFDNTGGSPLSNEEVWFEEAPVIPSTLVGDGSLQIVSATENSAVLSGSGVLTGIPYTHTTRTVGKNNPSAPEEKTASVTDCTLVSTINSQNLLYRLYAFYCPNGNIEKINNAIVYTDQRCGKAYSFTDPFGREVIAYLAIMDTNASSYNQGTCQFYADYEPAGQSGLYDHVVPFLPEEDPEDPETLITEFDWTVPDGVTQFKVVLIGGGTGGDSGWPGANGEDTSGHVDIETVSDLSAIFYGAEGGDGGDGGNGGSPGRVKIFTVENATPGDIYHIVLGEGGEGGAATGYIPDTVDELREVLENEQYETEYTDQQIQAMINQYENTGWNGSPNAGSAGDPTTISDGLNTWSSADLDGYLPAGGYYDPIEDKYYARYGTKGVHGGKGGARKVGTNGVYSWVTDGEDVIDNEDNVYHGGSTGVMLTEVAGLPEAKIKAYGGNGAGASVGVDRSTHEHINGLSDQETDWYVLEDE